MRKRNDPGSFLTCPGNLIHTHYEPVFDGQRVVLQESGYTNIQDEIESYGKYTDLHYMLHRLSVGDQSVIYSRPPLYGDFSGLPSNPVDAINIVQSAEYSFNALPLSERAAYNNDFRAWLAARLSGENSVVDRPVDTTQPVKPVEPEVVTE